MRLDRVWIDGHKNLKNVEVDFNESRLTTVIIGPNGSGKSSLLEAIACIFRNLDLKKSAKDWPTPFNFKIDYRINDLKISVSFLKEEWKYRIGKNEISWAEFDRRKDELLPDQVFGYYSGGNNSFEIYFRSHQKDYYDWVKSSESLASGAAPAEIRRLFFCRPVHAVFALMSFFAFPDREVSKLLEETLGITGFHSAMVLLRKPWYAKSKRDMSSVSKDIYYQMKYTSQKVRKRKHNHTESIDQNSVIPVASLGNGPDNLWGATGRPGYYARLLNSLAFFPMVLEEKVQSDYRKQPKDEQQLSAYIPNINTLDEFAQDFQTDLEMFEALESIDISDLIRWVQVWVTRKGDESGDISYGHLSEGERQILMVLGLIRLSRNKRTLFLLDEPDTHLNPFWQHTYLDLVHKWSQADKENCQFIISSHNPLTISALKKEEVRVMSVDDSGNVSVQEPYTDPRGMGFTATLTEIFGLPTSLDYNTQRQIDERNRLVRIEKRTEEQDLQLLEINEKLNRLGFMLENREPSYQAFLRALHDYRYADMPILSPDELKIRHKMMIELIASITIPGREQ